MINGAGATFPYPIYSKWFDEYAKVDPSVRFNYQSIGSGGGQKQILAQTVDFGASDGPMSDANLAKAPGKLLHIPTVAGAVVITYNLPGNPTLKLDAATPLPEFSWARSRNGTIRNWRRSIPGVNLPDQEIDRRPPLRRQRHHLHFHRLPEQGERGMEDEGGQQHFGQLADRYRRQGQRRCVRAGQADAWRNRLRGIDLRDPKQNAVCAISKTPPANS